MCETWPNDTTLEFLRLYEKYSVIWDPKNINHKNRSIVSDAWTAIQNEMSVDCTVEALKKKKESLMTSYRCIKRKVIESEKSGGNEIYKPTWFAFSIMDRFLDGKLKAVLNSTSNTHGVKKTEPRDSTDEDVDEMQEEDEEQPVEEVMLATYDPTMTINNRNSDSTTTATFECLDKKIKRLSDTLDHIPHKISKTQHRNREKIDECELYGQLIASKLRNISNKTRLILMNQIDNLIFQTQIKEINNQSSSSSNINNSSSPDPQINIIYQPSSSPHSENSFE